MGEVHTPLGIGFVCPLATTRAFVFVAALARAAAANRHDKTLPFDSLVRERVRVLSQQNKYIRIAFNSAAVAAPARPAHTLQAGNHLRAGEQYTFPSLAQFRNIIGDWGDLGATWGLYPLTGYLARR